MQGFLRAESDLQPRDSKVTRMTTRNELERGFQALKTLSRELDKPAWTSDLQSCELIYGWYFKPLNLW